MEFVPLQIGFRSSNASESDRVRQEASNGLRDMTFTIPLTTIDDFALTVSFWLYRHQEYCIGLFFTSEVLQCHEIFFSRSHQDQVIE